MMFGPDEQGSFKSKLKKASGQCLNTRYVDYRRFCMIPKEQRFSENDIDYFLASWIKNPMRNKLVERLIFQLRRFSRYASSKIDITNVLYVFRRLPKDNAEAVDNIDWSKAINTVFYPHKTGDPAFNN